MNHSSLTVYFFTLLSCFFFSTCSVNVADNGSGTNVGNAMVQGTIHNQQGLPLAKTKVLLIPEDYNPLSSPAIKSKYIDTTDNTGHYQFELDKVGSFNILAEHLENNTKLLIQNIKVTNKSHLTLLPEMLKKTGAIQIVTPNSLSAGYLYIPGTTLKQKVTNTLNPGDTVIFDSLPASALLSVNYQLDKDTSNIIILSSKRPVTSGDTLLATETTTFSVTEVLLTENFDDLDFSNRGWYDNINQNLSIAQPLENSVSSVQYSFVKSDTVTSGGPTMRHSFTESESIYLSFYIKYSENWRGSANNSGASFINLLTNKDSNFTGPGTNFFSLHIQQDSGRPVIYFSDSKNIDSNRIGVNLTDSTENRAVAGCNGEGDGYGLGVCIPSDTTYSNAKFFKKENRYFQDNLGNYNKNDWHQIKIHIKLNSIVNNKGVADGVIRYWFDNNLVMGFNHILFRTNTHNDMKFNQIVLAPQLSSSPTLQTFWLDSLSVSR